ncbi:MAG: double-strand break repair helicase AddA [Hyphomonadaceae bacterium]|nr:double-strand break repair helicase AddA [Hyphomonadaceae bacterium]
MTAALYIRIDAATSMQRTAAAPNKSVFVSANAGSGKTRVLVDRVSRILLAGTEPDKILCLTYTKAAASEMQDRLFAALGNWSIIETAELTKKLNDLEGEDKDRSPDELGRARKLFARALETPGGLKVQTIHAFCERLLTRFPLEAGIFPGTEAIDEREARDLHQLVIEELQTDARSNPDNENATAIRLIAAAKSDSDMDGLFFWMMGNAYKVDAWRTAGGVEQLAGQFGVEPDANAERMMAQAWEDAPRKEIKTAALDMQNGGKTDAPKAEAIFKALTAKSPVSAYQAYRSMFFTQAGKPNASMVTGKAGPVALALFGDKKSGPQSEAQRMIEIDEKIKAARVLELTRAVYTLALNAVDRYRALKKRRRVMDFDDQIHLARKLVTDSRARDWVRYKLDGGIDHILVDEAQDTSDAQWGIIDALSEEFFQPSPDKDEKLQRTLFAVGDEKQSIYSFQGARPEMFLDKISALSNKQAGTPDVHMQMSFRSADQILKLVDQVFYEDQAILESFGGDVSLTGGHESCREDCGLVEFWPAVKAPDGGEEEVAWRPVPVDRPAAHSTREQLARGIAEQIKEWLDKGEPIYDREDKSTRPMQARDIMILVTKRLPFFDGVIRNLKAVGVPVAGADRLQLTDSIAVQDLLSLAKFTQLPSDDLSLAEVLKSPMIGWDDEQLFNISHDRGDLTLWQVMPDGEDKSILRRILGLAARFAPYEFFARTLAIVPDDGRSLLKRIYDRIGIEAADALDAFLARALAHQRRGVPSLGRFISDIETEESKIKREMDAAQNEVRVMTVHAAKGLESPVVILPDTTQLPTVSRESFFPVDDGFVMSVAKAEQPDAMAEIVEARLAEVKREHLRLLYVALTRAETRLLICGFESRNKVADGSWHDRIGRALGGLESTQTMSTRFGEGLRYGSLSATSAVDVKTTKTRVDIPGFLRAPVVATAKSIRKLSPSKLVSETDFDTPVRSPLDITGPQGQGRFRRGNIIHKLLQILPDLPVEQRHDMAHQYLALHANIDADQIQREVFAVLEHPEFAPFFAEGSQAEVSLAGRAKGLPEYVELNGQIDRLSVQGDTVWIIDYKSNRPPPQSEDDVAEIYINQMAAYRALIRDLYPGKDVECALLWTDGPHLMSLSDTLLENVNWETVLDA